jgi:hypothetical protein
MVPGEDPAARALGDDDSVPPVLLNQLMDQPDVTLPRIRRVRREVADRDGLDGLRHLPSLSSWAGFPAEPVQVDPINRPVNELLRDDAVGFGEWPVVVVDDQAKFGDPASGDGGFPGLLH